MIEIVDLVDKAGIVRQRRVPRDEVNNYPDLYMQIVVLVIFNSLGKVLAQKRALAKRVHPGKIDHICGAIISGEKPQEAAIREAYEEAGIQLTDVKIIAAGLSESNRYRYILVSQTDQEPKVVSPHEVAWVGYLTVEELFEKEHTQELIFVDEYFTELEIAMSSDSYQQTI